MGPGNMVFEVRLRPCPPVLFKFGQQPMHKEHLPSSCPLTIPSVVIQH
jgi:hypothetical protein